MKYLVAAAVWLCLTVPAAAFDRARVLLSDHAVLCSPNTPEATARHLVELWGALLCVVDNGPVMDHKLESWVAVHLTPGTDSASTSDSLLAWKDRFHLTAAVISDDPALAASANAAGLRVYVETPEFREGGLALRNARGYLYYMGPSPGFFDRRGLLADPPTRSRLSDSWNELASSLFTLFSPVADTAAHRWSTLLAASYRAETLASKDGLGPEYRALGERWRSCVGWWLAPALAADTLRLFVAQESVHTLRLVRGGGAVTLSRILSDSGAVRADWRTTWPLELERDTTLVSGRFRSDLAGSFLWTGRCEFEFEDVRFTRTWSLPVEAVAVLQARLVPPVFVMDDPKARTKPGSDVSALSGQIELSNGSSAPLAVHLGWRSDLPVEISSPEAQVTLAPGESRRAPFTVSLPRDPAIKDLTFGVDLSAEGVTLTADGQIWRQAPHKTGAGRLGLVGASGAWLAALPDLGLTVDPLVPGQVKGSLHALEAIVIRGGTPPAGESDVSAVSDFVARGGVAILEIERAALKWLPWQVSTIRKPAPFAASFYKDDLTWWQSPNGLVGGCFAAVDRDSVLTLASGDSTWEPLVVDEFGKGFMYRRRSERGWYVLVHSGWWPRLEQVERRAYLGLFNLVSTASN